MKIKSILTYLAGIFFIVSCQTKKETSKADFQIIPMPKQISNEKEGHFALNSSTKIVYPEGNEILKKNAIFLSEYIEKQSGIVLNPTSGTENTENTIQLKTGLLSENKEAYQLTVNEKGITIEGADEAGVFYGIQTLRKSIPVKKVQEIEIGFVSISDAPRFGYRGAHLDVARHFFPVDSIKIFVDMLALHNMNTFHWHLTDDQGWRVESKKYPELTQIGSKRKETVIGRNSGEYDGKPYEGFYTQDELKEIVAYAKERHITVIPEIDLPGHMQAVLATYPELGCTGGPYEVWTQWGVSDDVLCAGNQKVYRFIEDILNEVADIFPSEYMHIGGDESPKVRWEKCPKCQLKIKELGIKKDDKHTAEEYLQSHVISFAERVLAKRGRKIIGWDEILEGGIAPNATVMSWRGIEGGTFAAQTGHDAIMTPMSFVYFDYYQSQDAENEPLAIGGYTPVERVYSFEPIPDGLTPEQQKRILGAQANIWTEYIKTFKHVQYMALPRFAALAEVQWTQPEKKNYPDFLQRVVPLIKIYELYGYNYATHIFDLKADISALEKEGAIEVAFATVDNAPVYYTLDGSEPTEKSEKYTQPIKIRKDTQLRAIGIRENGNTRIFAENFKFNKATARAIDMKTEIYSSYKFGGASTLVDGCVGNHNFKTGRWIAFSGNDLEAVIDLVDASEISKVGFNTNVITGDWIYDARSFSVAVSDDGKNFQEVASETYPQETEGHKSEIRTHSLSFNPTKARYVKIKIASERSIPNWHTQAKGKLGFLFVDEITIE
ncbi:glycoside hydrolase family 20 protein [Capnocytophaga felis]|uniref:beta-N-acetylhexosaminidase n=1 Tax=Capnocytophaga felis TaxID=2267611 RepID=A0A5M4B8W0_9FLAO|nr:family 20 glycosylhydrolase [Capnocytophaga felis]GET46008.1 beta-N-acetylhexosaminidase [Capnocytophaga felis]GET49140.1 beta-N-acetylhexosaminidase [Capnocytophaga felis]